MFNNDLGSELIWYVVRYANGQIGVINSDAIESSNAMEYIEEFLKDDEEQDLPFATQYYGEAFRFFKEKVQS